MPDPDSQNTESIIRADSTDLQSATLPDLAHTANMSNVPERWDTAWDEFSRKHPRMKRGSSLLAVLLFTVLGQSVLGVIQLASPFLPWFAWPIMFLATIVLAQMFVGHFSTLAHHRLSREAFDARQKERDLLVAALNAAESRSKSLQLELERKNKQQDLSIKQERVFLESNPAGSGEPWLVHWHVTILLYITNRHEFDNAIREFGLILLLPNGEEISGVKEWITRLVVKGTWQDLVDLGHSCDQPLKRGHPLKGAVRFRFSTHDLDLNLAGTAYVLRIQDVYDKAYKREGMLPEPGDDIREKISDRAFGGL